MNIKLFRVFSILALTVGLCATANATAVIGQGTWETTLQARDLNGDNVADAYYDTVLKITWLADTNYAQTSGYDADGIMTWFEATDWVASLDIDGNGLSDGWRLPDTVDVGNDGPTYTNLYQGVDYGFNITTHSEMSHMFYNTLGNIALYDITGALQPGYGITNTALFNNLQNSGYWSATEWAIDPTNGAWKFGMAGGSQGGAAKTNGSVIDYYFNYYSWAVHDGSVGVAISAVPIPAAVWLLGSGLIGLVGVARRRKS